MVAPQPTIYTLVKITRQQGFQYNVNWHQQDGTTRRFSLTQKEYEDLALPGAGAPPKKYLLVSDAEWQRMWESGELDANGGEPIYDTPSTMPEPGSCLGDGAGKILIRCPAVPNGWLVLDQTDVLGALPNISLKTAKAGITLVAGVLTVGV